MNLHVANPHWVHLLWAVAAVAGLGVWLEFHGSARLGRFISRTMQDRLVSRPSLRRRLLRIALLALAGVSLTFAMMRPQWGLQYVESRQMGAEIMVCLDVSKSMLAEDVAPNRLERAKAEIADLVSMMEDDHVGLIAFAGKATVLSPMTPDRGFLKLILSQAGPHSVARGGTNLEAPIRKALAGFRSEADISRIILLITDGEDHDSFCKDAAKAAAERGVRIIAMGLGDENGSEITMTDPKTGARKPVLDSAGKRVISRLDGELLREIALATEGVYVPAGTGALDLRNIYDAHIAPLMRASLRGKGRMVRNEAFQWFVVAGIVFAVAGSLASGGSGRKAAVAASPRSAPATTQRVSAACLAVLLMLSQGVAAQTTRPASRPTAPPAARPARDRKDDDESAGPDDPRERYNMGLASLESNDLGQAEKHLLDARTKAGADGEARYRATFNLGWVNVRRADALVKDKPAQALKHLQAAADWFRDAVRLRPRQDEPRRNLDLISRRILELADTLRKQQDGDLAARLDALIAAQRGRLASVGAMVQLTTERPHAGDALRKEFRQLGAEQRKTLSEALDVTDSARHEHDGIEAVEADKRSPQQRVRLAQLRGVLAWCERASQRVGQARSQLRRRQAERAYRRVSASLDLLKRARDQLRNPAEVLGALIADTTVLLRQTGALLAAERMRLAVPTTRPAAKPAPGRTVPAWLTARYLEQTQQQLAERTGELQARLAAGLSQLKDRPPASQPAAGQADQQARFLAILQDAVPLIEQAAQAFGRARQSLAVPDLKATFDAQAEGLTRLARARELFLDMRGLIEVMYADEKRIEAVLAALAKDQDKGFAEYLSMLREANATNAKRAARVDAMLDDALAAVGKPPPPGAGQGAPQVDPKQQQADKQRLTLAKTILGRITDDWQQVDRLLAEAPTAAGKRPEALRGHTKRTVEQLEALRRLFFTLVEHLRDTLRRQVDLNDRTQQVADDPNADQRPPKAAPLADDQQGLARIADQIGQALAKQSQQDLKPPSGQPGPDPKVAEQMARAAERLAAAARKVRQGHGHMTSATEKLTAAQAQAKDADLKPAREDQDQAAERLAEALALLSPRNNRQQQQEKDKQDRQGQNDTQDKKKDQIDKQRRMSTAGMLQAIRDREQQRQRDRSKRRQGRHEPVEKDW